MSGIWLARLRALEDLAAPMILREYPQLTNEQAREALHCAYCNQKEIREEIARKPRPPAKLELNVIEWTASRCWTSILIWRSPSY